MKRKRFGQSVMKRINSRLGKPGPQKENSEIKSLLAGLYPGKSISRKYQEYQRKKYVISAVVMISGIGAFVCMQVGSRMYGRLEEGTRLSRNEWGEGSYFVTLQAQTALSEGEISYRVDERIFTEEEIESLLQKAQEELLQVILAENVSLRQVCRNLNLVSELKDYPFVVSWKSSDYNRIRTDGKVNMNAVSDAGEEVLLTAIFTYEGKKWEQPIPVRLVPKEPSEQDEFLQKLQNLLSETNLAFAEETMIILPGQLDGESVSWQEKKENNAFGLLFLGVTGAFLCAYGMDRELQKKSQARKEEIVRSYPEFVSRLKLYMGAGLTVRNAFLRIGKDYQQEKRRTGKSLFLYEELLISGYQLMNGKSEDVVYREWSRRCDVICCRKLGFLLTSSLRQGNEKILSVLEKEAGLALEEQKKKARKQGEEAGIKMLFPMMLMLLMVMFLILLPAFTGMQGM